MRLHPVVIAAVASLTIVACQPQGSVSSTAALSDADRTALQALFDSTAVNVRAHNWDAWAAVMTDDVMFLPTNHPMIHGRAATRAWVDSFPTINEFNFTNVTLDGVGNLAWGTSGVPMTLTVGGQQVKDVSKQLVVLKKQPDGKWKVVAVAVNSDLPPMAPPPAAAPPTGKKK
jgi:ketosteroid isomerase-like protein